MDPQKLFMEEMEDDESVDDKAPPSSSDEEEPKQNIGDIEPDICWDNKVKKEIMVVGSGAKKPRDNYLVTVDYKLYFFDHEEIEEKKDF